MLRLSRPKPAQQLPPSATIARARLRCTIGADRSPAASRLAALPATYAEQAPAAGGDDLLARLLREALAPEGRQL